MHKGTLQILYLHVIFIVVATGYSCFGEAVNGIEVTTEDKTPNDLYSIGRSYYDDHDYHTALFYFVHAIAKAQSSGKQPHLDENMENSKQLIADASTFAGIIFFERGDYTKSLEYFYDALGLYQDIGDGKGVGNLLNNVGTVYFEWEEYELALDYFLQAEEKLLAFGFENNMAMVLNNIAGVYVKLGQYARGLDYFFLSYYTAKEQGEDYRFKQLYNIGYSYYKLGDYELAETYLRESLAISQARNHSKDMSMAFTQIAKVHIQREEYRKGLENINRSMDIAHADNLLEEQKNNYLLLSEVYEHTGDHTTALKYHKQFFHINDSIFNSEKHRQIRELQILYETEKSEREIHLLRVEREYQNLQIDGQKRWIRFLLTGILLVTLLLMIVINQKRNQKRANIDLVKKNLEIMRSESEARQKELAVPTKAVDPLDVPGENPSGNKHFLEDQDPGLSDAYYPEMHDSKTISISKYHSSSLSDTQKTHILNHVLEKMENRQLYRDKNFTLDILADAIGTNRTYISQVINEKMGRSFSQFVNEYRIREARMLLVNDQYQHYTIEAIAQHVGFKSKSSFHSSFKKLTGITPLFFQKKARFQHT